MGGFRRIFLRMIIRMRLGLFRSRRDLVYSGDSFRASPDVNYEMIKTYNQPTIRPSNDAKANDLGAASGRRYDLPREERTKSFGGRCEGYTGEKIIHGGLRITIGLLNSFAWLRPDKGPSPVWIYIWIEVGLDCWSKA